MPEARRHHFVPAFFLSGFTAAGRRDEHLWVTDRTTGRRWRATPDRAAAERDFYRIDDPILSDDHVERELARLEGLAAPILKSVLASGVLPEAQEEGAILVSFLGILAVRSPGIRRSMIAYGEQHVRSLFGRMVDDRARYEQARADLERLTGRVLPPFQEMKDLVERPDVEYHLTLDRTEAVKFSFELTGYVHSLLFRRHWSLVEADAASPGFVTSDTPVPLMLRAPTASDPTYRFILSPTEITIPISRTRALIGFEEEQYVPPVADKTTVARINARTAYTAKYVYSAQRKHDFVPEP